MGDYAKETQHCLCISQYKLSRDKKKTKDWVSLLHCRTEIEFTSETLSLRMEGDTSPHNSNILKGEDKREFSLLSSYF